MLLAKAHSLNGATQVRVQPPHSLAAPRLSSSDPTHYRDPTIIRTLGASPHPRYPRMMPSDWLYAILPRQTSGLRAHPPCSSLSAPTTCLATSPADVFYGLVQAFSYKPPGHSTT